MRGRDATRRIISRVAIPEPLSRPHGIAHAAYTAELVNSPVISIPSAPPGADSRQNRSFEKIHPLCALYMIASSLIPKNDTRNAG